MLVVVPLAWIGGSYVPDRLDVYVGGERGDAHLTTFTAGVEMDGSESGTRVSNFSFSGGDVHRLKMYFNAGCPVERLRFGFENGPASFSIDKMTVMHRCVLMRTLQAKDLSSHYDVVGDATVVPNGRGGLNVKLLGEKVEFRPRKTVSSAWKLSVGSDRRLAAAGALAEVCLFVLSFAMVFFVKQDGDSWCAVAAKSAAVAFAATLLFLVALPIQSYLVNRSSFPFSFGAVLVEVLACAAVVFAVLAVVLFILHYVFSYVPHVLVLGVTVCEYLISGVMSIGLPPLNGEHVWWLGFDGRAVLELAFVVFLVALFVLLRRFVMRHVYAVSSAIVLMTAASMADVKVEKRLDVDSKNLCSPEDVVRSACYSATRNVFVFILDAASTPSCSRELDASPELRDLFPGFVQCRNNLSMGDCTSVGLPGLMTGLFQGREEDTFDYAYSFFGTNSFVMAAAAKGVPTYFIPGLGVKGMCSRIFPAEKAPELPNKKIAESVFDVRAAECLGMNLGEIVKFRTAPLILKLRLIQTWLSAMDVRDGCHDESGLYPSLGGKDIVSDVPLTLHVYHTVGMHVPIVMNRSGALLADPDDTPEGLRGVSYAKLHKLGELFRVLRKRGIYDKSLIVVCGDHGHSVEPLERRIGKVPVPARAFSFLMVKPVGAKGEWSHDDVTPTSHCAIRRLVEAEITRGPLGCKEALSLLAESKRIYREADMEWEVDESMTDSKCRRWRDSCAGN